MSMHLPLTVRLKTAKADRQITRDVRDVQFRTAAPGGFASATVSLDRPLLFQSDEIAYYATLYIYDGRNGTTLWEGRVEDLGRGAGPEGEVWDLAAIGPSAHAQDVTVPLIYVDRRTDPWIASHYSHKAAQIGTADDEDQVASIQIQFARGAVASDLATYLGDVMYHGVRNAGMKLARVSFDHREGVSDSNWRVKLITRTDDSASTGSVVSHASSTTQAAAAGMVGDANFVLGNNAANLRLDRDTSTITVSNDNTYTVLKNIALRTMLMDQTGADITAGYTSNTVLASEVVADLLGRLLPKYDGDNAEIAETAFGIEQLAWPDGVTPAGVLEQLMQYEPGYYWVAGASGTDGRHSFKWAEWPITPRYEATVKDGIDSPASADGLWNAVTVIWRDPSGRQFKIRDTSTVDDLDAAGLTREALIDLGDEGTLIGATQAGSQFLEEHRFAPNAGTLTVARPVVDRNYGRMVQPWEIEPGNLIRVRGIMPRTGAYAPGNRDGVSVFRIVSNEYRVSTGAATLELDSSSRSVARSLARLPQHGAGGGRPNGPGIRR